MDTSDSSLDIAVDMLVRRPPEEVYEAFGDPDGIRKFWLASSSGRLETGALVRWRFKIAGAETDVRVIEAAPSSFLDLRWDGNQPLRIRFREHELGTVVDVAVPGFSDPETAIESMSGFTLMLSSLKIWLENGIEGVLQYDKFPDADYADR